MLFRSGELGTGYYAAADAADACTSSGQAPDAEAATHAEPKVDSPSTSPLNLAEPQPGSDAHEHYWGQALQTLDCQVAVRAGKTVSLVVKREPSRIAFSLRQGIGEEAPRPPWLVRWGGGASVENPHVQRVHYCELLVRDFLQRVKSKRFPPIEEDLRIPLAHSGSLILDVAALQQVRGSVCCCFIHL